MNGNSNKEKERRGQVLIRFRMQEHWGTLRCSWRWKKWPTGRNVLQAVTEEEEEMIEKPEFSWAYLSFNTSSGVDLRVRVEIIKTVISPRMLWDMLCLYRQTGEAEVHWVLVQVSSSHLGGCSVAASSCQQRQKSHKGGQRGRAHQVRLVVKILSILQVVKKRPLFPPLRAQLLSVQANVDSVY